LAVGRIDSGLGHFAILREHCQQIDETAFLPAQPGFDHLAGDFGFDDMHRMGERHGFVRIEGSPSLFLCEASLAVRGSRYARESCAKRDSEY
jgi:hypothetical protein